MQSYDARRGIYTTNGSIVRFFCEGCFLDKSTGSDGETLFDWIRFRRIVHAFFLGVVPKNSARYTRDGESDIINVNNGNGRRGVF